MYTLQALLVFCLNSLQICSVIVTYLNDVTYLNLTYVNFTDYDPNKAKFDVGPHILVLVLLIRKNRIYPFWILLVLKRLLIFFFQKSN